MRGATNCAIFVAGGIKVKRCSGCKETKPIAEYALGSGPGGYSRHCKNCHAAYRKRREDISKKSAATKAAASKLKADPTPTTAPAPAAVFAPPVELPGWLTAAPRCHYGLAWRNEVSAE